MYKNNQKQRINFIFSALIVILLFCGISFGQITDGLAGWWKLNDAVSGNTAVDSSGNGHNGTIVGAEYVNGRCGDAINFISEDGSYIDIPASAFTSINNRITIALWQYGDPAVQPKTDCIFEGRVGGNRILNSHLPYGDGRIFWDAGYSGSSYDRTDKQADSADQYEGQWNHWAFTKDTVTGTMKMYLNGQLWYSTTGKTKSMAGVDQFTIGSKTDGTNNYDGMVYDFRVYNRVLTDTEIATLSSSKYAHDFSPENGSDDMEIPVLLEWTSGGANPLYNVYFSDDLEKVINRDENTLVASGFAQASYEASGLNLLTTYYWTVDVYDGGDIYSSEAVMSFTTESGGYADNPSPADGEEYISASRLSWEPGSAMISQNVYFGTDYDLIDGRDPAVLVATDTTASSYKLGTLVDDITYYWLVDTISAQGTDSLGVWSFTAGFKSTLGDYPEIMNLKAMTDSWLIDETEHAIIIPDNYLAARWNFEGNLHDSSGHEHHGSKLNGTAAIMDDAQRGKVLKVTESSNDYVDITGYKGIGGGDSRTVCAWIKTSQTSGHQIFLSWGKGTAGQKWSFTVKDTSLRLEIYSGDVRGTKTVADGQWHHVAVVFDNSISSDINKAKLFVDGVADIVSSSLSKVVNTASDNDVRIGGFVGNTDRSFNGMIDDVRIYSRVLSADEILNIYNNIDPVAEQGIICTVQLESDLNSDCKVNYLDFSILANRWIKGGGGSLPPMPADVPNYHPTLANFTGNIKAVATPIKWQDIGCNYTYSQVNSAAAKVSDYYHKWSRGKVQMVGYDGTGTQMQAFDPEDCSVPYNQTYANIKPARDYLRDVLNIPSSMLEWTITSGISTANSGGMKFKTKTTATYTPTHECGHCFRLGHGQLINYKDGVFDEFIGYGDRTTNMGNVSSNGFNLPQQHRLGWVEEDEVAVFKPEDSGTVYHIRNIKNYDIDPSGYFAGVVYYVPQTGNRLWISVNRRSTYEEDYLGNQLALTKYITGWQATNDMIPTICVTHMIGEHTDCFGLTYECVAIDETSEQAWADIRITYNPANVTRNKDLIVTPTLRLLQAPADGVRGQMEVTIEVTNPNPPTTTPCIQQTSQLSVRNSYKVKRQYGIAPWEPEDQKSSMHAVIPGGMTTKEVYIVESEKGPLTSEQANLTGSYQLAHRYPFEFSIDFE